MTVLSHFQTHAWLEARHRGAHTARTSLDLGLSAVEVRLDVDGAVLPDGTHLQWNVVGRIADSDSACFTVDRGIATAIQAYSEAFQRAYSLYPTASAPTMLVGGKPMHRIKDTNPRLDTLAKVRAAAPIYGMVLDTCTGLGYTAIEAAKTAALVTTIELDPAAQQIARANPWSAALFDNPRIVQIIGDAAVVIQGFETGSFNVIVHDPPMLSLGGELYSKEFYHEAYRVLKAKGRMFHYVGNPESGSGATVTRGVIQRLRAAGFHRVVPRPEAFGVLALR